MIVSVNKQQGNCSEAILVMEVQPVARLQCRHRLPLLCHSLPEGPSGVALQPSMVAIAKSEDHRLIKRMQEGETREWERDTGKR